MKNMAIVCNIGHFDSEIQIGGLSNMKWVEIKPQVDEVEFADGGLRWPFPCLTELAA